METARDAAIADITGTVLEMSSWIWSSDGGVKHDRAVDTGRENAAATRPSTTANLGPPIRMLESPALIRQIWDEEAPPPEPISWSSETEVIPGSKRRQQQQQTSTYSAAEGRLPGSAPLRKRLRSQQPRDPCQIRKEQVAALMDWSESEIKTAVLSAVQKHLLK
jgi:hypothetical protein